MALLIDNLPPQTETWINTEAQRRGILPEELVKSVFSEQSSSLFIAPEDIEEDATMALLQAWMNEERVI